MSPCPFSITDQTFALSTMHDVLFEVSYLAGETIPLRPKPVALLEQLDIGLLDVCVLGLGCFEGITQLLYLLVGEWVILMSVSGDAFSLHHSSSSVCSTVTSNEVPSV